MTDRELLQSISDIIIGKIGTITDNMATKEDISNMATKEDISNMATKKDISNMATKAVILRAQESGRTLRLQDIRSGSFPQGSMSCVPLRRKIS